jgi:DNA (cytosine-5)-methyltransferase 1
MDSEWQVACGSVRSSLSQSPQTLQARKRTRPRRYVVEWAKAVQPRVIILENVEEFKDWGPLDDEGMPFRWRQGTTFNRWKPQLKNFGYELDYKKLRACNYSAPTIRKRLFIVARRDGQRII